MSAEYGRLCEATAGELFGSNEAGLPVYTLPEDDAIERIVAATGLDSSHPRVDYCRIVRSTLYLDQQGHSPLRWHTEATQRQLRGPLDTPPSLPLLVVFTLAAEMMHADTDMAANNFYGRVLPLLEVPEERARNFVLSYQQSADLIWRSLNVWLEAWEGERGIPTAYSLGGMRYIGLPMSQAVVRQHDRVGLVEVFEDEGLPPGFRMSPEDMQITLDSYATTEPSPLSRNVRRLWANTDARARIVQAACLELEAWAGGARRDKTSLGSNSARLIAYVRTFPRKVLELNLNVPAVASSVHEVTFRSQQAEVSLPAVPSSPGNVRLAALALVSPESLLANVLHGRVDGDVPSTFARRPRRVTPLRWDEIQGCYVEAERVAIGEQNLVLAVADSAKSISGFLDAYARPGWSQAQDVSGVPDGWVMFRDAQIIAVPEQTPHLDLLPLVPRSRSTLTLRGGFDLPGRLRKWSSLQPPEAVAYAAGADSVAIRLFGGSAAGAEAALVSVESAADLAILSLGNYELSDGEYVASMFVDGEKKPRSNSVIRLRSANTPVVRIEEADIRLVYSPASGSLWPLSAGPANWRDFVNGARVEGNHTAGTEHRAMREFAPRDRKERPVDGRVRVRVGEAYAPDSCMVTGRHRFELPPALGGRSTARTILGECATCGLVKRFAATAWEASRRNRTVRPRQQTVDLPPIVRPAHLDGRILFDAICHVGQGSTHDIERIAAHIEGSGLQADRILRTYEVLGHIDVSRDEYLITTGWAVNAPTAIPLANGEWIIVGSHSQRVLTELREHFGTDTVTVRYDGAAARVSLAVSFDTLIEGIDVLDALGIEVRETSPALRIASSLPPLSCIETGLKRVSIPSYRTLERWDTASATWFPSDTISAVGAYRLRQFQATYVVRSQEDLEAGLVGVGTAQLVKHIANSWVSDPLAGYHTRTGSVVTPLGADLPGLYGRALALCTGAAPIERLNGRMLQYPEVPRAVADIIFDRITR